MLRLNAAFVQNVKVIFFEQNYSTMLKSSGSPVTFHDTVELSNASEVFSVGSFGPVIAFYVTKRFANVPTTV